MEERQGFQYQKAGGREQSTLPETESTQHLPEQTGGTELDHQFPEPTFPPPDHQHQLTPTQLPGARAAERYYAHTSSGRELTRQEWSKTAELGGALLSEM
eukprot:5570632-Amphidinium_carterae.1